MSEPFNVLLVGVGGQGVVLASDILTTAAMLAGRDAKKSEIHGMSQRGGPVFAHVRFGDVVHSPVIPKGSADVLLGMERMELLRWAPWAKPDAVAAYVAKDIVPTGVDAYPDGIDSEVAARFARVVSFDSKTLRPARVSPKVAGTVLLGAASVFLPLPPDVFAPAMEGLVPDGTLEMNKAGFALGRALAETVPEPSHA
ncbi:indolepyruvate oxidoreductase subunit beta [Nigerium sp.]|uniref:indolepyruvate oxidoreductase subunit beta n=1 Tax=Nigerium sp. TaxID=2042655 RepID=UPI0032221D3E